MYREILARRMPGKTAQNQTKMTQKEPQKHQDVIEIVTVPLTQRE